MDILVIAPHVPFPGVDHAGGAYLLHHLEELARDHRVTLLVPYSPERREQAGRAPAWLEVVVGPAPPPTRGPFRRFNDAAYRRLMGCPPGPSPETLRSIRAGGLVERARAADLVELQWPVFARFATELRRAGVLTPVSVVEHDVELGDAARRVQRIQPGYRRLLGRFTAPVAHRTERRGLAHADLVLVFSSHDRDLVRGEVRTSVLVVDPWLDVPAWDEPDRRPGSVLFTGAMWRPENADGVVWFLREVWPAVRREVPNARLIVAGAGPGPGLRAVVEQVEGVHVTGAVPDLLPYYRSAALFVAPLFVAGGMKFKVPQALICGLPVVATTRAVVGIAEEAPLGTLWAVTDEADVMARAVSNALRDPYRAAQVGRAGRDWARERFSFKASLSRVHEAYRELVSARPGPVSTATLLICTWKRPGSLSRALAAVASQRRPFDEVVVVVRPEDQATRKVVATAANRLPVRQVLVREPGLVAARNAGLAVATGDIVVYLDDDAAPGPEWLGRMIEHYDADPRIGAVGGRDAIHHGDVVLTGSRAVVGRVTRYGRFIGSHYMGSGPARDVDVLKGANMSFRRQLLPDLRADTRLRGDGAEHYEDWTLSLAVKATGLRVVFDPAIHVDHYEAERPGARRSELNPKMVADRAHNQTYAAARYLSPFVVATHCVYALLIGSNDVPGLGLAGRHAWRHGVGVTAWVLPAALSGRAAGIVTGLKVRAGRRDHRASG